MTDLEFQKLQLKRQRQNSSGGPFDDVNICVLAREEESFGDLEDNLSSNDEGSRARSASFESTKSGGDGEFNLNCSFSGGYMPNTDLSRVDKGQGNPQFSGLDVKS